MTEVVVTALGVKRERKSLGYAVGSVDGEKLTIGKSADLSTALSGKVSGIQLNGSPSSTFDNGTVIVRGINGLTVGEPLYVVDGTITLQENVIMDNVENISVLKGAAATALYGQRAYNGVIMITTKKGKRNSKPRVDVNSSYAQEKISLMPKYQNQYAGGYAAEWMKFKYDPAKHPASWASFDGQNILDYGADESWGPKIDGTTPYRAYWSWYPGAEFGQTTPLTAQPDNVRDFYQTGRTFNNSVSVSGGGSNYDLRLTYANINRTLIQPNTKRDQHQVNLSTKFDFSSRITASSDIGISKVFTHGQPLEGYRSTDHANVTQNFNQWWQRQIDMTRLRNQVYAPDGKAISWNIGNPNSTSNPALYLKPQYWENPYFVVNNIYQDYGRNRLFGNVGLNVKLNDWINWQSYVRMDQNAGTGNFRVDSRSMVVSQYLINSLATQEMNYETALNLKKKIGDFDLDGMVGGNIRKNKYERMETSTAGGLSFPNFFNVAASIARPVVSSELRNKEVRSVYGRASAGYKGFAYLEGTLRNDWSSTLPKNNNSYLYPSLSGSFVGSEFFGTGLKKYVNYFKLRGSFAQVGSDLDPYSISLQYNSQVPFNGQAPLAVSDAFRNEDIKPALTKSGEIGAEFKFLNNRLGLDAAYYVNNSVNQILTLPVSGASGFANTMINAGRIESKGWEVSLNALPVKAKDFSWDITLNLAHNETWIRELTQDLKVYQYASAWTSSTQRATYVYNKEGYKWGQITTSKWRTDAKGRVVVGTNGLPLYDQGQVAGYARPDLTGGLSNMLKYKNFDLSFSMDFQKGGKFFSTTRMFNMGAGLSEETVGVNDKGNEWRTAPSLGGGIRIPNSVFESGADNTKYITARDYFYNAMQRNGVENLILDASYLKLRDVRLGYTLPGTVSKRLGAQNANVGLFVNNAYLIWANSKKYGVDPSEIEDFWFEGGQLFPTRTIGMNLKLTF